MLIQNPTRINLETIVFIKIARQHIFAKMDNFSTIFAKNEAGPLNS